MFPLQDRLALPINRQLFVPKKRQFPLQDTLPIHSQLFGKRPGLFPLPPPFVTLPMKKGGLVKKK